MGLAALAQGPLIKLLPKYQHDVGLLGHEKTHVRQWYAVLVVGMLLGTLLTFWFWPLYGLSLFLHQSLHKFIRPYRRWREVQAYRKQIAVGGYTNNNFAVTALVGRYDLGLSANEVRVLLSGHGI